MDLIQDFTCSAMLKLPLEIEAGPIGTRLYFEGQYFYIRMSCASDQFW